MFEKIKLKKEINKCQKRIAVIEQRRMRSQAALVEAILTNKTPHDTDVDYFNNFTAQIDEVRNRMHELQNQLKDISSKK